MKHSLLIAAAATALVAAPTVASAQDSGVYIKGQAGYGVFTDSDIVPRNSTFDGMAGEVNGEGNLALGLGIGFDFENGWRVELEGSQLYNDMGAISGQPESSAKFRASSLMLNALYDFEDFGNWEPYVGAGVGLAKMDIGLAARDFVNDTGTVLVRHPACVTRPVGANTARACIVDDDDTGFAWNLIAGLGYNITDNLTWDTNYRYMDLGSRNVGGTAIQANVANVGGVFSELNTTVEDIQSHTVMTGFRYRFGKAT
ncbi:MAG: outer membrane beta-barrel protein, partial [Litorimonas sp.]